MVGAVLPAKGSPPRSPSRSMVAEGLGWAGAGWACGVGCAGDCTGAVTGGGWVGRLGSAEPGGGTALDCGQTEDDNVQQKQLFTGSC